MARFPNPQGLFWLLLLVLGAARAGGVTAWGQVAIPERPPAHAAAQAFQDGHFGVQFEVPGGWTLTRKDGEVSTFHLEARTASSRARMRSVVAMDFNPYPYSTFSGARFYYSVEPHSNDAACAREAKAPAAVARERTHLDLQDIDGMEFAHGHDEHGEICVEARDEVYTAYRKGSCYRFDLAVTTFCAVSSGAAEMTEGQLKGIDQQMTDILSTVRLAWTKGEPHPVPPPRLPDPAVPLPPGHSVPLSVAE